MPGVGFGVYPGYVDAEIDDAQHKYWGRNLKRLEQIKLKYYPMGVFSNPQSVRPAKRGPGEVHERDEL